MVGAGDGEGAGTQEKMEQEVYGKARTQRAENGIPKVAGSGGNRKKLHGIANYFGNTLQTICNLRSQFVSFYFAVLEKSTAVFSL